MSTRRHNLGDGASRGYRGAAVVPISRHGAAQTMGYFSAAAPGSSSTRRTTYEFTSHVRNENAPTRFPPEPSYTRVPKRGAGMEQEKISATSLFEDQRSMDARKGGRPRTRDKLKPAKEVDIASSVGNRTGDRRDAPHEMGHPPLEGVVGITYPSRVRAMSAESRELGTSQHNLQAVAEGKASLPDTYATLMQQCEEQSRKLSTALQEKREIADAYATLHRHYEEQSREFSTMRHRCQQAENDYAVLRKRHEEQSRQLNTPLYKNQTALGKRQKAEDDYANLKQGYEAQRNQISALGQNNDSLKALLEQRTSELYGVERFLTTADTFSGSEVVSTLRKLNEGVQQSMTFMAEWMVRNLLFDMPRIDKTGRQITQQTRMSELLGMQFMQLLRTKKHVDNPVLVEIALQAYLMYELRSVASQGTITQGDQSRNSFIDGIYQRMREAEGQAVSGNWRALTHLYAVRARTDDPELTRTMDTTIISGLSDVLLAAGCTSSKPNITSALKSKFGEKIRGFVSLAGHVNTIIAAGVISEDFEVLVVSPGTPFNEKAMEDWDDNGVSGQGILSMKGTEGRRETVLCTIELGLMKRTKVAGARERGELLESIMIKPKVALVSAVLDIIQNP